MGCGSLNAGHEDYAALVWRRRQEGKELVGEHVMTKYIGGEDFPKCRLIFRAVAAFKFEISGAGLSSGQLADGA